MKMHARGPLAAALLLVPALYGCSSPPQSDDDPLEDLNRATFWVNNRIDDVAIRPLATAWDAVAPDEVEDAVGNFFNNLMFPVYFVNNLLQGEPEDAFAEVGRFVINSTAGVGGFMDVADEVGLESHPADFGQTLGVWGIDPGPFLILPLVGPSNFRDAVGLAADSYSQPLHYFVDPDILLPAYGGRLINERARNLETMEAFDEAALDPYTALRDAYFQRRQAAVHDGAPEPAKDESLYDLPKENE